MKIGGCLQAIIKYRNELCTESEITHLKEYFLEKLKELLKNEGRKNGKSFRS